MRTFGRGVHLIASYRQSDSDPLPPKELGAAFRQLLDADCLEYDTARSYGREPNIGAALASLPLAFRPACKGVTSLAWVLPARTPVYR